jgi:predicted permease
MYSLWKDVLYAGRTLRNNPGFAAVAILSLALGIGANSAIFSFADCLMFRPMQVPRTGEVVSVFTTSKSEPMGAVSYRDYVDFRDNARTMAGLAAYKMTPVGLSLSVDQIPELSLAMVVTGNFFPVLEVEPTLGRNFRPEEDSGAPGAHAVAVLGYGAWQRRFNSSRDVLGRSLRINGQPFTIVGVAPKSFPGVDQFFQPEVYVPMRMFAAALPGSDPNTLEDRGNRWLDVAGRLKAGEAPKAASAECAAIMGRLASTWPATNANRSALVMQERAARFERDKGDGQLARSLLIIVGLVLLIACANVANLLLARATARAREMALRIAVGAGRMRLVRQLLTENLIISILAGAVGLVFAFWGVRALSLIKLPSDLPISLTPRLDARALWFTALVSIGTGLLFGLAPAWKGTRTDLVTSLKGAEALVVKGSRRFTLRNILVVVQVTLSVTALTFGGLLARAFLRVESMDMGFRTEGVLLSATNPAMARYTEERGIGFYQQLVDRVKSMPGVRTAALTSHVPFAISGYASTGLVIEGYDMPADQENVQISSASVSQDYFGAMGIRLAGGREFDSRDTARSQPVVIVNQEAVKKYWHGRDPVGARVRIGSRKGPEAVVIGVAANSKYHWVLETPTPFIYRPYMQAYVPRMTLLTAAAATGSDPSALAEPVRREVKSMDPNIPVFDVRTFRTYFHDRALAPPRILSGMVIALGTLGIALAMVGLYAVIAYAVSRRTREIGIRLAIGADIGTVRTMVLKQGFVLGGIGVVLGLGLALSSASGLAESFGPGSGTDLLVYVAVPALLLAAIAVACWVPARRAAKIQPWIALRYE